MSRQLLVCVDGSEHCNKAFDKALQFKKDEDMLYIVYSCQFPEQMLFAVAPFGGDIEFSPQLVEEHKKLMRDQADQICKKYQQLADERKIPNTEFVVLESSCPKEAVCTFVEEKGIDTAFVGTRGLGALKKVLLGSFSDYMLHHLDCDVVVAK